MALGWVFPTRNIWGWQFSNIESQDPVNPMGPPGIWQDAHDALVGSGYVGSWDAGNIHVGSNTGYYCRVQRSYIFFNTSAIPSGSNAKIKLTRGSWSWWDVTSPGYADLQCFAGNQQDQGTPPLSDFGPARGLTSPLGTLLYDLSVTDFEFNIGGAFHPGGSTKLIFKLRSDTENHSPGGVCQFESALTYTPTPTSTAPTGITKTSATFHGVGVPYFSKPHIEFTYSGTPPYFPYVFFRYSVVGSGHWTWTPATPVTALGLSYTYTAIGLTPDTDYYVEFCLYEGKSGVGFIGSGARQFHTQASLIVRTDPATPNP